MVGLAEIRYRFTIATVIDELWRGGGILLCQFRSNLPHITAAPRNAVTQKQKHWRCGCLRRWRLCYRFFRTQEL